jgi:MFS family permease
MGVCLTAQIASVMPVFLLGALAPLMSDDLGLTPLSLGAAVAAFYLAAALGSFFLAPFADTSGVWRVTNLSLLVVALTSASMVLFADTLARLFAIILLAGLVNGCIQPATNVIVSRFIPAGSQGLAYGLKQSAIPLSTMFGGIAVPTIGLTLGWRWAFMLSVFTALMVLMITPKGREIKIPRGKRKTMPLARKILIPLTVMMGLAAGVSNAMAAFLALSITAQGHSASYAGLVIAAGSLICVIMRIGLGVAADRWKLPLLRMAAMLLLIGAASYLVLAYSEALHLLTIASLLAFGFGWGWSGLLLLAIGRASSGAVGAVTGVTHAGVYIGGVLGPVFFGWIAQAHSFTLAWQSLTVISVIAAGLSIRISVLLRHSAESQ